MSDQMLVEPVELTDAELDFVTGGQVLQGGLVNIGLSTGNIQVIDDIFDVVDINDSIKNIANNNNVSVGAVIAALGGVGLIKQRQAQA